MGKDPYHALVALSRVELDLDWDPGETKEQSHCKGAVGLYSLLVALQLLRGKTRDNRKFQGAEKGWRCLESTEISVGEPLQVQSWEVLICPFTTMTNARW